MALIREMRKLTKKRFVIDFSLYKDEIENYAYFSYRKKTLSALTTADCKKMLLKYIEEFYGNQRFFFNLLRFCIDFRNSPKEYRYFTETHEINHSIIYKVYCNGFTFGFKKFDKIINQTPTITIDDLNRILNEYKKEVLVNLTIEPTKTTTTVEFFEHITEFGELEGAEFRIMLLEKYKNGYNWRFNENQRNKAKLMYQLWYNVKDHNKKYINIFESITEDHYMRMVNSANFSDMPLRNNTNRILHTIYLLSSIFGKEWEKQAGASLKKEIDTKRTEFPECSYIKDKWK